MHRPWYRTLFHRRQTQPADSTTTAADHEEADAQFCLGQRFDLGKGSAANDVEAAAWYRRAATLNHAPAQFNLGMMLAVGRGTVRNEAEARRWIRRAAMQGHVAAQYELGARHRRDSFQQCAEDAAASTLEAYKWFRLAAAQGHDDSVREFQNLRLRMTDEQLLEGDESAGGSTTNALTAVREEE